MASRIAFTVLVTFLCSVIFACSASSLQETKTGEYVIWAHSDIHPRNHEQKWEYEAAIDDIISLGLSPDMAVVPGDLVYRQESQMYWDWMKNLREKTGIKHWFEIAGNHDLNDEASYYKNSGKPMHYAVRLGNVLFIFLSDEIRSAITDISDEAVKWWERLVIDNQDSIIVTVTHACYAFSGFTAAINWTMVIKNSARFHDVLKRCHVDLWLSGHTHLPAYFGNKAIISEEYGTLFLDVSSIKKHIASPVESWLLILENGSSTLRCYPRNHEKKKFYNSIAFTYELSHAFRRGSGAPEIVSIFQNP